MKSGWAAAVVLAGPGDSPRLLESRAVELSDGAVPETRQPYHAGFGTLEGDDAEIARRTRLVRRAAGKSVGELLRACRGMGCALRSAGLVVGSRVDPASIANPHIRAHALEGRLFRTVLEETLGEQSIPCRVLLEREANSSAAEELGRSEEEIKRLLAALGRGLSGPWRADQKLAAVAAWIALAAGGRAKR